VWCAYVAVFSCLAGSAAAEPAPIAVESEQMHSLTLAEIIVRIEGDLDVGTAREGIKLMIFEELRASGYNVLGAEDLVFGDDRSHQARFLLGGTVRELECLPSYLGMGRTGRCRIAIEWQLKDKVYDHVVYRVTTRAVNRDMARNVGTEAVVELVRSAVKSLLSREAFAAALRLPDGGPETETQGEYAPANFLKCEPRRRQMPDNAETVLAATVLIKVGNRFGSGVVISPDGFILTAAHVVRDGQPTIHFRDLREVRGQTIRVVKNRDVALLKVDHSDLTCLDIARNEPPVGDRVFAVGSPASTELAFSLSTGVVSAYRNLQDIRFLQTDASVSRGNSGGPLVDQNGSLLGIVSWKLVGPEVEGVAFGIPTATALDALAINEGATTAEDLTEPQQSRSAVRAAAMTVFEDEPDPTESLDPQGDARRARRQQAPWYYHASRWGGLGLAVTGAAMVGISYGAAKAGSESYNDITAAEFQRLEDWNTASWVIAPVGIGLFVLSYFLLPKLTPENTDTEDAAVAAGFSGNSFSLSGVF
jgi:S1-C subfamily serine protease